MIELEVDLVNDSGIKDAHYGDCNGSKWVAGSGMRATGGMPGVLTGSYGQADSPPLYECGLK